jgi:hypothetical protein
MSDYPFALPGWKARSSKSGEMLFEFVRELDRVTR